MKAPFTVSVISILIHFLYVLPQAQAIGIVVPRIPDVSAPVLQEAKVDADIKNNIARTRITQVFRNENSRSVEADFYFPVPDGADITDFVLYMNGKPVKGEVLDKEHAHALYRDIVRKMKDPGLIEWKEKNLFRVRIFPIPAHGEQKFEIEISQQLTADQGYFRYHLPLEAGNHPASSKGQPHIDYIVRIEGESAIRNVYSPTHKIDTSTSQSNSVTVNAKDGCSRVPKDFSLFYEGSTKEIAVSLLAQKSPAENGYFSLRISPPWDQSTTTPGAADYLFVIDSSGSMAEADKMDQARKALRYCVSLLDDNDRFNLVRFSTTVEPMLGELAAASSGKKAEALKWIDQLQARGGTNISEALKTSLKYRRMDQSSTGSDRLYTVVFITDGQPTVGETSPEAIAKMVSGLSGGNVRIFTFGVGHDVNTRLIDTVAESTRAASDYVAPEADLEVPIGRFFDKVSRPALYNLELDMPAAAITEVFPAKLPDLFYGTELAIFGRYKQAGPTIIKLRGTMAGVERTFEFEKTFPAEETENGFLEKLWATRKVAWLLDQMRKSGESKEVQQEVEDLAKNYGIVTPYTSYLAMEDEVSPVNPNSSTPPPPFVPGNPHPAAERFHSLSRSNADSSAYDAKVSHFELSSQSGAAAVNTARKLGRMKAAESLQSSQSPYLKHVRGKTFALENGIWKDKSIIKPVSNVIRVKFLSDAWFQIADKSELLRTYLEIGERVHVLINPITVLEIDAEGVDSIDVNTQEQLGLNVH